MRKRRKQLHRGKILEQIKHYKAVDCVNCGFVHLVPIPTAQYLKKYYQDTYYEERIPEYIKKEKRELSYWKIIYGERLKVFNQYIHKKEKRVVDIGCGHGLFLKFFKEHGWKMLGIEPSLRIANYAERHGIGVIKQMFTEIELAKLGKFDGVHMRYVLEHIEHPYELCKSVYKILHKGGIICIDSANDFNPLQKILRQGLRKRPYWLSVPDHINYFTPDSLKALLEKVGFEVVRVDGTFPMEFFVLMGDDYIGNDKIGRKCHQKRMNLEMHLYKNKLNSFKKELYQFMINRNIGREIIIYGRK